MVAFGKAGIQDLTLSAAALTLVRHRWRSSPIADLNYLKELDSTHPAALGIPPDDGATRAGLARST